MKKRKFDLYLRNGLGKKEPLELLPLDVDRLRVGLQKKGKKTTAARVLELLRRSINFGIKRGLVFPYLLQDRNTQTKTIRPPRT